MAFLNWFSEESYEYKFIKRALEDVDEVDRIAVPANDKVANQTKIPDVGPSTNSAAPVTHHRPTLTPLLATETRDGKMYPIRGYPARPDPNGSGFIRPV